MFLCAYVWTVQHSILYDSVPARHLTMQKQYWMQPGCSLLRVPWRRPVTVILTSISCKKSQARTSIAYVILRYTARAAYLHKQLP